MRIQRHIYFLSIIILFFNYAQIFSAEVIPGNSANSGASFSFAIQEHVSDEKTGRLFVAAAPHAGVGTVTNFALSVSMQIDKNNYKFEPLTPETIIINASQKPVPNPLFDAGIEHLGLISGGVISNQQHPILVKSGQPYSIYFFENLSPLKLLTFALPDANGQITGGIVGLSRSTVDFSFAAVKPSGSAAFGAIGSGIAVLVLGTSTIEVPAENDVNKDPQVTPSSTVKNEKVDPQKKEAAKPQTTKKTILDLGTVDALTGMRAQPRAFPFDITIDQLKIGNDLANMGQIVDMHWDVTMNRLYIALQITAGSQATDGGRALVVGHLHKTTFETNDKKVAEKRILVLEKIAPDQAFTTDHNNIVGAVGANAQVSLHKVRTLFTSTGLHAVVVVGGNGDADTTKRSVYALPVVNNSSRPANNGVLASKHAIPVDEFQKGKQGVPDMFVGRSIKQPALTPDDMFVATDAAARVGAGDLEAGDITDIFVRGDAVFVTAGTPADSNALPGIFYSQAIFNELGMIKAWTAWRRVAGTTNQVFGGAFDIQDGNFLFMTHGDGDVVNTVKHTVWNNGAHDGLLDLNKVVTQELPMNQGGIQSLVDLPADASGLHDISLMMMTGNNKVVLVESGQVINDVLHPLHGSFAQNTIAFTNGTITTTLPLGFNNPKVVSIAGGVLDDIGPLTTTQIARNGNEGNNGWLFVGGINGLAVLSAANGDGWNTSVGLGPDFAGLEAGMSFKIVPGYTLVRKLILDENFLYVLTDTKLDRIDLTQGTIGLGQAAAVTVAAHTRLVGPSGFFSDCVVSGKCAVIATSRGLLRVGNGKDIRFVTHSDETGWTPVAMPEGVKGVRQLCVMSRTGMPQDVARNDGGQIYALNVDRGTNRSDVTRFAVNSVDRSSIDDNTITLLPDFYIKGLHSYRINFGALRTVFSTDGALYLSGHGIDLHVKPAVTFPRNFIGSRFVGVHNQFYIPLALDGGSHITNITRSFASGSWLISGDFGLRINE